MTLRSPEALLGAGATVVATVWAVATMTDGGAATHVLPAVATAVLVTVAVGVRSRAADTTARLLPLWFVPGVVLAAAAGGVVWGLADGTAAGTRVGVAALVMASPAAAMLGVPLAFATGSRRARSWGVTFDRIETAATAARVDTLVLEKDGTVTTGDLTVVSVDPVEPDHDRNLRWFAGALEKASDHPVGRAVATLSARGRLTDVEVVDGHGIRGSVDRHPVRVGSPAWIGIEPRPTIWTTVGVEVDGRTLGSVTVADDVRPDLARDVGQLKALGLDVVLVSADTEERTRHVAGLAGISRHHGGCDAGRTADVVRSLSDAGSVVATAGTPDAGRAALTFATTTLPSTTGPTIVVEDLSPLRLRRAVEAARATTSRVARVRLGTAVLCTVGVAAALTGVAGPVVMAATAAAIVAATTVLALAA